MGQRRLREHEQVGEGPLRFLGRASGFGGVTFFGVYLDAVLPKPIILSTVCNGGAL